MPHLLAIDKGTSVVKAVLFDQDGREVATAHMAATSRYPRPGWHEEDPELAWNNVAALVRAVVSKAGIRRQDVMAIAVTAHMAGLILLDAHLRPVYPNVLWDDARAADIVREWQKAGLARELFEVGGQAVLAGLTVPLLRWFALHQPEVLNRARYLCTTKDYLVLKLTGILGTDESDAGWMPGDVRARSHSRRVHELCGVASFSHLFPPVRRSEQVAGELRPEAAAELGLPAGTRVVAGLGDANASTVGVGAVKPGQAASIIGTSLLNNLVVDHPVMEPFGIGFVLPTVGGCWLRMLPNTGGGSVNLKWLVELAYQGVEDPYTVMDREVSQQPLGSVGVFYHPYITNAGVVAPFYHLGARAQFTGLHVGASRGTVARAVYEGIAFSMLDCYGATPVEVSEVRVSGGAARSSVLCQIVADALGKPVLVPDVEEAAALGAALVAGWGVGLYPSLEEAARRVSINRRYDPSPENHEFYRERYALFREIRETMEEVWNKWMHLTM